MGNEQEERARFIRAAVKKAYAIHAGMRNEMQWMN